MTEAIEKQNGTIFMWFSQFHFILWSWTGFWIARFLGRPGFAVLGDIQVYQISQTADPWVPSSHNISHQQAWYVTWNMQFVNSRWLCACARTLAQDSVAWECCWLPEAGQQSVGRQWRRIQGAAGMGHYLSMTAGWHRCCHLQSVFIQTYYALSSSFQFSDGSS